MNASIHHCSEQFDELNGQSIQISRDNQVCMLYNCASFEQADGYTSFRESCNSDCRQFKLQTNYNNGLEANTYYNNGRQANTSCRLKVNGPSISAEVECLELCLNTPRCRALTFNHNNCRLFTCVRTTERSNLTYIKRICIEGCQRKQMQKCGGCVMDTSCSQSEVVESMEKEECLDHCRKMDACKLAIYSSDKRCQMTSCPYVYQGKFSNFTLHPVWIKTCRSDCSDIQLYVSSLESRLGYFRLLDIRSGKNINDCINQCLNMNGCWATYYSNKCLLLSR